MTRLHIPVALRWTDLDAYQHVNNAEFFRLLEEARITALWARPQSAVSPAAVLEAGPGAESQTLAVAHRIEYLRALPYSRSPVRIELWISRIGRSSVDVCYEVHGPADDAHAVRAGEASEAEPYARATTTLVVTDRSGDRARAITGAERAAWEPYVEDPPGFRGSGRAPS